MTDLDQVDHGGSVGESASAGEYVVEASTGPRAAPREAATDDDGDLGLRRARFDASSVGMRFRRLRALIVMLLLAGTGCLLVTLLLYLRTSIGYYPFPSYGYVFLVVGVVAGFGAVAAFFVARELQVDWAAAEFLEARKAQTGQAAAALRTGPELSPTEFAEFWQATYDRLTDYHREAGQQLRSSYRLAQMASLAGFVIVLVMGVAAAVSRSVGQSVAVGGIAAVGGALAAYVSHTFRVTYERSLGQRMSYFEEPVVSARLLAAERLLKEFSDEQQRDAALLAMIRAVVGADEGNRLAQPKISDSEPGPRSGSG